MKSFVEKWKENCPHNVIITDYPSLAMTYFIKRIFSSKNEEAKKTTFNPLSKP